MEKRGYAYEFSGLGINVQEYAREEVLFGCFFPRLPYIQEISIQKTSILQCFGAC